MNSVGQSFWRLQIAGWLVYLFLIYVTFLSVAAEGSFLRLLHIKTVRSIIGFLLTCFLWQIYRRTLRHFQVRGIVATVLVCSVTFGILWTGLEAAYAAQVNAAYDFSKTLPRLPRVALDYTLTIMAWSAIYFGIKYWQQWQTERENSLQATILAEKAQLEMLRYQLNPHFLFNALNSIRASVDEDRNRAKKMITQLSEFLRHSLLSGESKEIPLREELEAVRNYLAIEKIRFEEKLEVKWNVEEAAQEVRVPCFILNPLVENAIKHGMRTSPRPLCIQVSAMLEEHRLQLEVTNTGNLESPLESNGTHLGLRNTRERLEKLFPGRSSLNLFQDHEGVVARIVIELDS